MLRKIKTELVYRQFKFYVNYRISEIRGYSVRQFIRHMARPQKEVSISRIAKEGGVSVATVSRVMNRRVGVSEETRARIDNLLRKYAFTTHYPQSRPPKIAVLIGDLNNYTSKALKGIFAHARESSVEITLITKTESSRPSILERIRDQQCAGVIVLLADHYAEDQAGLSASELPVILLDAQSTLAGLGFIDNDSYTGSCEAARHLMDHGHQKIGFLRYLRSSTNQMQRLKGYTDTLLAAGIEPKLEWISESPLPPSTQTGGIDGFWAMEQLFRQAPDLTAVLAVDDELALGALTYLHQSGRKVPEDVSLVGFDNYPETEIWYPSLTTVDHPIERAGYLASKSISEIIANPGTIALPRMTIPTRLIVRKSTGPVRTG